jgi:hypothetical protein
MNEEELISYGELRARFQESKLTPMDKTALLEILDLAAILVNGRAEYDADVTARIYYILS